MKELLDKLSSYNLFNYLLPGVLFAVITDAVTLTKLLQKDLLIGAFVYYFLGAVVSRIGSLVVEPILIRTRFIAVAPYADFVRASKEDPKLEVLSETNNMYRTLCALFLLVALVAGYDFASTFYPWLYEAAPAVCIVALFLLFLISYRKQTAYVVKRIQVHKPQAGP
jgi:hypothetical protein